MLHAPHGHHHASLSSTGTHSYYEDGRLVDGYDDDDDYEEGGQCVTDMASRKMWKNCNDVRDIVDLKLAQTYLPAFSCIVRGSILIVCMLGFFSVPLPTLMPAMMTTNRAEPHASSSKPSVSSQAVGSDHNNWHSSAANAAAAAASTTAQSMKFQPGYDDNERYDDAWSLKVVIAVALYVDRVIRTEQIFDSSALLCTIFAGYVLHPRSPMVGYMAADDIAKMGVSPSSSSSSGRYGQRKQQMSLAAADAAAAAEAVKQEGGGKSGSSILLPSNQAPHPLLLHREGWVSASLHVINRFIGQSFIWVYTLLSVALVMGVDVVALVVMSVVASSNHGRNNHQQPDAAMASIFSKCYPSRSADHYLQSSTVVVHGMLFAAVVAQQQQQSPSSLWGWRYRGEATGDAGWSSGDDGDEDDGVFFFETLIVLIRSFAFMMLSLCWIYISGVRAIARLLNNRGKKGVMVRKAVPLSTATEQLSFASASSGAGSIRSTADVSSSIVYSGGVVQSFVPCQLRFGVLLLQSQGSQLPFYVAVVIMAGKSVHDIYLLNCTENWDHSASIQSKHRLHRGDNCIKPSSSSSMGGTIATRSLQGGNDSLLSIIIPTAFADDRWNQVASSSSSASWSGEPSMVKSTPLYPASAVRTFSPNSMASLNHPHLKHKMEQGGLPSSSYAHLDSHHSTTVPPHIHRVQAMLDMQQQQPAYGSIGNTDGCDVTPVPTVGMPSLPLLQQQNLELCTESMQDAELFAMALRRGA